MYETSFTDDNEEDFRLEELLGEGSFAKVYRCVERRSQTVFALKEFDEKHEDYDEKDIEEEVAIWKELDHANIVTMHASFKTGKYFYFVLEFVDGGNLFNLMMGRENYSEKEAASILKQILEALRYLHTRKIVHRDVKPDNVLVKYIPREVNSQNNPVAVKLADFGFAIKLPPHRESVLCTPRGAPMFLAPETILEEPIGCPVDLWACGVLLHLLVSGYPPFWSGDNEKMLLAAVRGQYTLSSPCWKKISNPCKNLIQDLLTVQASHRITAKNALDHPWILKTSTMVSPFLHRRARSSSTKSLTERLKATVSSMHSSFKNVQRLGVGQLKGKYFPLHHSAHNLTELK